MNSADHFGAVDPLQIDRGDPEIGVPELALDHVQRHSLARHLDRMRVAELMRCEAASDMAFSASWRSWSGSRDQTKAARGWVR